MTYSVEQFKSKISQSRGLARTNLFGIQLAFPNEEISPDALNVLCKSTEIPGRTITTSERMIGGLPRSVATGSSFNNIQMSFHLTNIYEVKKFFDMWQNKIVSSEPPFTVGYYDNYTAKMSVMQLRKGESFNVFSFQSPIDLPIPDGLGGLVDRLPTFGVPNIFGSEIGLGGPDLGNILTGGNINLAIFTKENIIYQCDLLEVYPVMVSPINFTNEQDGIGELNVEFAYYRAVDAQAETDNTNISDTVNDTIDRVYGAIFGPVEEFIL